MGKKSKNQKKKNAKTRLKIDDTGNKDDGSGGGDNVNGNAGRSSSLSSCITTASSGTFTTNTNTHYRERERPPKDGWARELRQVEKALKKSPQDEELFMTTAKICLKMRLFSKLRKLAGDARINTDMNMNINVDINTDINMNINNDRPDLNFLSEENKHQLNMYLSEADAASSKMGPFANSQMSDPKGLQDFHNMIHKEIPLHHTRCDTSEYGLINPLHCAARSGDVRFLEHLVSLGMPLDYPTCDLRDNKGQCKFPGATALIIALQGCLTKKKMITCNVVRGRERGEMITVYLGQLQCAVQLVWLGADCTVTLPPFAPAHVNGSQLSFMCQNLVGKTAQSLATMLEEPELLDAIDQLKTYADRLNKVNCRCGSRLPWRDCHYSTRLDTRYYQQWQNRIIWKTSPLAVCPLCKNTKKTFFRCCWNNKFDISYRDDITGELRHFRESNTDPHMNEMMVRCIEAAEKEGRGRFVSAVLGDAEMNPHEKVREICDFIRATGKSVLEETYEKISHPKSRRCDWDADVYAGTMERISMPFNWDDTHWKMPKTEVLLRTKKWNDALEKYCNEVGLEGEKREEVVRLHAASPLAPCANLTCDKVESKVKEFRTCSKCKAVAYCCLECQREDWKRHKNRECTRS